MPRAFRMATSLKVGINLRPRPRSLDTSPTHSLYRPAVTGRALSSAGERSLHTGEVIGSIPIAPTIFARIWRVFLFPISSLTTFQNGTKREDDASSRGESVDFVLGWFRPNAPYRRGKPLDAVQISRTPPFFVAVTTLLLSILPAGGSRSGVSLRGSSREDAIGTISLVPLAGLEPAHLAVPDFESGASTNSATGALRRPYPKIGRPLSTAGVFRRQISRFQSIVCGPMIRVQRSRTPLSFETQINLISTSPSLRTSR